MSATSEAQRWDLAEQHIAVELDRAVRAIADARTDELDRVLGSLRRMRAVFLDDYEAARRFAGGPVHRRLLQALLHHVFFEWLPCFNAPDRARLFDDFFFLCPPVFADVSLSAEPVAAAAALPLPHLSPSPSLPPSASPSSASSTALSSVAALGEGAAPPTESPALLAAVEVVAAALREFPAADDRRGLAVLLGRLVQDPRRLARALWATGEPLSPANGFCLESVATNAASQSAEAAAASTRFRHSLQGVCSLPTRVSNALQDARLVPNCLGDSAYFRGAWQCVCVCGGQSRSLFVWFELLDSTRLRWLVGAGAGLHFESRIG
jgi:hypothetical protein